MARGKDTAHKITLAELQAIHRELQRIDNAVQETIDLMRNQKDPDSFVCFNYKSMPRGLQILGSFANSAINSCFLIRSGKPLPEGSLKERSIANKETARVVRETADKVFPKKKKK